MEVTFRHGKRGAIEAVGENLECGGRGKEKEKARLEGPQKLKERRQRLWQKQGRTSLTSCLYKDRTLTLHS